MLITETGSAIHRLDITYGPDRQRWKTVLKKNNVNQKNTVYAGNYEKITDHIAGDTTKLHYLHGGLFYMEPRRIMDQLVKFQVMFGGEQIFVIGCKFVERLQCMVFPTRPE